MVDKKKNNETRILRNRKRAIREVLNNRGFLRDRDRIYWEREKSLGEGKLHQTSNVFRSIMTFFSFELPLSKLDFINVKSLYDLEFDTSSLNIFAGTNSSGKSSILETIAMLSKWSSTTNSYNKGISFSSDFGTMSFDEFKSFNSGDEPAIITLEFKNVKYDDYESKTFKDVGNLRLSIELNKDIEDKVKESNLKYAPISKFSVEIQQHQNLKEPGFTPINASLEFVNQSDTKIMEEIVYIRDIFKKHFKATPNNSHTGFINMQTWKHIAPHDIASTQNDNLSSYSSYADIEVSTSESKTSNKTRLYGVSFDNTKKMAKALNPSESWNGYIPISKGFLIKWLAIDYIMSNKNITKYLVNDLLEEEELDDLMENRSKFIQNVLDSEEYEKMISNEKVKMFEVLETISHEIGHLDSDLNLIIDPKKVGNDPEIQRHIENTYDLDYLNFIAVNGYFDFDYKKNPLIAWFEGDTSTVRDYEQLKLQQIEKISPVFEIWKNELKTNYEQINDLLNIVSEKVIKDTISKFDNNDDHPMQEIYKSIDKYISKNKSKGLLPIIYDWSSIKFYLLEYLSEKEYSSDTYLAPMASVEQPHIDIRYNPEEGNITRSKHFFDSFNNDISRALQDTLSATVFVGPLRERYLKDEEIFSFSHPFLLGKMGELSGSFLGTYGKKTIQFPTPDYLIDKKLKSQTYFEHLSDWLNHIGIAESINAESGYIYVTQNKNKLKLENVGVGVSQVLPVLLSCMISTTGEKNEIVLLEQPELHLHPSAQANLADFFIATAISETKNLFIETHSEHVVNRLKTKRVEIEEFDNEKIKIYFATKDGDQTSLKHIGIGTSGEYLIDDYPDGFFDQAQKEAYSLRKKTTKKDKK